MSANEKEKYIQNYIPDSSRLNGPGCASKTLLCDLEKDETAKNNFFFCSSDLSV